MNKGIEMIDESIPAARLYLLSQANERPIFQRRRNA